MKRIDAWLGKHLFHPPIILVCQLTGVTQYALYRYLWWGVALWMLWSQRNESWGFAALFIFFAFVRTLSAGIAPDRPRAGSAWVRAFFLISVSLQIIELLAIGGLAISITQTIAILFAEYALTIRTIPPRETREKSRREAEAGA